MTDRLHAGEDIDVPELDDVLQDTDPADGDRADELLEGLPGTGAAERDDVPSWSRLIPRKTSTRSIHHLNRPLPASGSADSAAPNGDNPMVS